MYLLASLKELGFLPLGPTGKHNLPSVFWVRSEKPEPLRTVQSPEVGSHANKVDQKRLSSAHSVPAGGGVVSLDLRAFRPTRSPWAGG